MILYPTDTLYALGVNALDTNELQKLYTLKERDQSKAVSWLVRDIADIERYGEMSAVAAKIAERFLPGSLTLVLQAKEDVAREVTASNGTVAFRITKESLAQELIKEFMAEHEAPLTCTSANVSGASTLQTVGEILQQFGPRAYMIDRVIDDGPRKGLASTIVRVLGDEVTILREGEMSEAEIRAVL